MERGDKVQVTEYGGRKLVRRVVVDRGRSIVVCNENDYANATGEGREPEGIGFRRDAVRKMEEHDTV